MLLVSRQILLGEFEKRIRSISTKQFDYTEELTKQLCTYYLYLKIHKLIIIAEDVTKYDAKINKIDLMFQSLKLDKSHLKYVEEYMKNEYTRQRHLNAVRTIKNSFKGKFIFKELINTCYRLGAYYDSEYIFQFPYEIVLDNYPSSNSIEQIKGRQSAFIIIFKLQQLKEPSQQNFQEFCYKALFPSLRGYNFQTEL